MKILCTKRRRRWVGLIIAALLVLAVGLLAGCCLPRHPREAYWVLKDIAAGHGPSRLKELRGEPLVEALTYDVNGRSYAADSYLPRQPARGGIVLIAGAAEAGKDDPRLTAFAKTLARAGFAVLVPDIVSIREFDLGRENVAEVAGAVRYWSARGDLVPSDHLGIVAASYAVGPSVLAAMTPDLRDRVQFILGVGGYHDIESALTFLITGYFRDRTEADADWRYLKPYNYGKWVFLTSQADELTNQQDADLMRSIAGVKLDDPNAPVDWLVEELSSEGRQGYELLTASRPERVAELLPEIPEGFQEDLRGLDVSRRSLDTLGARMILVHGRDDPMIPFTESVALAAAAPEGRAELYLIDHLAHVDVGEIGFRDGWRLWCAVDALLRQRARGSKE